MNMQLTERVLTEIKANKRLRNRLALELDKSGYTILRWVGQKSDSLTKATAIKIIKEETGLNESQILTEGVEVG